jgi:hypothetical protein
MSVRILALALVGCGRIAFDAPLGDATSVDAAGDTGSCTFGAWGTPVPLPEANSDFDDGDASLTDDGTELFFESRRAGSPDLYHATRECL